MNVEKIEYRPLDGTTGHLGGIESIVLDNVIYYFGFDYSSDLVISPLINNLDHMCEFAEKYMLQRDGHHDVDYWRELASYESELCWDATDKTFMSTDFIKQMSQLAKAKELNIQTSGLSIPYHLCYLLGAAGEWVAEVDLDLITEQIAVLNGDQSLGRDQSYSQIASDLEESFSVLVKSARGNWPAIFSMLDVHQTV